MKWCASCGDVVFFRPIVVEGKAFCSHDCVQRGRMLAAVASVPEALLREQVARVHSGQCPTCAGPGPVDIYVSHRIWSAFLLTGWNKERVLCCRTCGTRKQRADLASSAMRGWWGLPWGLFMTPVQLVRSLRELRNPPSSLRASARLEQLIRVSLAARAIASGPGNQSPR